MSWRFCFMEVETVRNERDAPREVALATLGQEQIMLQLNRKTVLQVGQDSAAAMGEAGIGEEWLNGLWVLDLLDPAAKPFYFSLGLASGDRITRLGGKRILSMRALEKQYQEWAAKLEAGEPVTIEQDIERGEFRRIELCIHVK